MPRAAVTQADLAARVRQLRGPRSQQTIAQQVGVSLRAYQAWEAGGGITWSNLERLARAHGVEVSWLLDENGPTTRDAALEELRERVSEMERKLQTLLELALEGQLELAADSRLQPAQASRAADKQPLR